MYTGGASSDKQDARLRLAIFGCFWGRGHASNVAEPWEGYTLTNQRAELRAVVKALRKEVRPMEVRTDSQYVLA